MKINWGVIKFCTLLVLIGVLFGFTNQRNRDRNLVKTAIDFLDENPPFVTIKSVNKLLIQNHDTITSIPKEALVLKEVEQRLLKNKMIKDAQVYITVDGTLGAKIKQRNPIARVSGVPDYYIDEDAKKMPLSSVYTARVPIITGAIDENINEITALVLKINTDQVIKNSVVGLDVDQDGTIQFRVRKHNFKVLFGKTNDVVRKFQNYKAFYQKIKQDSMLSNYKIIDLRFGNQVVATKK